MCAERLRDPFGREVTSLRVSVTDRCNLVCFYCRPKSFVPCSRSELFTLEEIARVAEVAAALGIGKIRLTGGEPLLRSGVVGLVERVARIPGIDDLALSSNGALLGGLAAPLAAAGLRRVNVSLDTLRPERLRAISGSGELDRILDGIAAARRAGLRPIKLNTVVIRGVNDDEIGDIARFAASHGAQARFIEYMPVGADPLWRDRHVARAEIVARLGRLLADDPPRCGADPATYYRLRDGSGEVGIISPISCGFCSLCNRLRLTADGRLRPCLTSDGEIDLRTPLRAGARDAEIADLFRRAVAAKPERSRYVEAPARPMIAIGG
ncbi:MAG: GTP 3',8-cyclase MoaA [Deltaproteobacteria bacterium]|nr:GTP 3',8-cyclase MoaA [Deltaproteobacteria bacterium]